MSISFDRVQIVDPSPEARRVLWHVLSVGIAKRDEPEHHPGHDKPGAFLFCLRARHFALRSGDLLASSGGPLSAA